MRRAFGLVVAIVLPMLLLAAASASLLM